MCRTRTPNKHPTDAAAAGQGPRLTYSLQPAAWAALPPSFRRPWTHLSPPQPALVASLCPKRQTPTNCSSWPSLAHPKPLHTSLLVPGKLLQVPQDPTLRRPLRGAFLLALRRRAVSRPSVCRAAPVECAPLIPSAAVSPHHAVTPSGNKPCWVGQRCTWATLCVPARHLAGRTALQQSRE